VRFTTLADGSLLFEAPFPYFTKSYYQDPENPLRYIPKYQPCVRRRIELATLPCGRCTGNWRCDKFNRGTSVPECEACDAREDQ
jgi:hypothetical protein